jgi:hypothetical protein
MVHWQTLRLPDGRRLWGEDIDLPLIEDLRKRR